MRAGQEEGFALISCLLFSLIIFVIGMTFTYRVMQRLQLAREIDDRVQADLETWSAYQEVLFVLTSALIPPELIEVPREEDRRDNFSLGLKERHFLNLYGEPIPWGKDVTVTLQDTAGKVSLLGDDPLHFRKLLEYYGLEPRTVSTVIDSLADWQDEDDFKRLNGAEKWQYKVAEVHYEPRNFFCQSLDELHLVRGMTPEIYDRVVPELSYLGTNTFNVFNASASTLRAVLAPHVDLAERLIDLRRKGILTPGLFQDITGMEVGDELGRITTSRMEITVEGVQGKSRSRIKMIYSKRETQKAPFQVELWQK